MHFRRVQPHRNVAEILQHDDAQPHTFFKTKDAVAKLGWTVLPQPPCSPDLALTGFSLFGALKYAICARRIGSDDEVTEKVEK
jgi:histone-lysine N-methyltransferase SETMAR